MNSGADKELHSIVLKDALDEIINACPDIRNVFLFNKKGEVEAGNTETSPVAMIRAVTALRYIIESSESAGDVETVIVEGSEGKITLNCFGQHYLVTVTSENADIKYVNLLIRVIIPTVLRLIERFSSAPTAQPEAPSLAEAQIPAQTETQAEARMEPNQAVTEEVEGKEIPQAAGENEILLKTAEILLRETEATLEERKEEAEAPKEKSEGEETPTPETSQENMKNVVQLIVESLEGLLAPQDVVRVSSEILIEWGSALNVKSIETVEIETLDGKIARFKVKPIKDSKLDKKGVIQIPGRIQQTLKIKSGDLVKVKPAIREKPK